MNNKFVAAALFQYKSKKYLVLKSKMASKNKQKKPNNGDQPIDSDSGSDSGDDEKYTGNEVAFHI